MSLPPSFGGARLVGVGHSASVSAARSGERSRSTSRRAPSGVRIDLSAEAVLELAQLETNFRAREAILRTAVAEAGSNARPRHEAQLLLAWGDSQYNQGNSAGAMTTFRRAIDLLEKTNMHLLLADAYTGLGRVYRLHGDHDSARTVYRKALTVLGDSAPQARGRVLEMLAVSYASTGQREEAVRAINESVGLARNAAPRVQTKRLTSAPCRT